MTSLFGTAVGAIQNHSQRIGKLEGGQELRTFREQGVSWKNKLQELSINLGFHPEYIPDKRGSVFQCSVRFKPAYERESKLFDKCQKNQFMLHRVIGGDGCYETITEAEKQVAYQAVNLLLSECPLSVPQVATTNQSVTRPPVATAQVVRKPTPSVTTPAGTPTQGKSPVSLLQEMCDQRKLPSPKYQEEKSVTPQQFKMSVCVGHRKVIGNGKASKQEAKHAAAASMLSMLQKEGYK